MSEPKLPDGLEHLRNIIQGAKGEPNYYELILRNAIKAAADTAPAADIIRIAELMLKIGIEIEQAKHARWN